MKNSNSIFTRSSYGMDNSVWVTMLVLLLCSIFFLGFKLITRVDCSVFEIKTSGLRQQTNNVFYVGEAITFSIPADSTSKVEWDFGDGLPAKEGKSTVQHSFLKEDDRVKVSVRFRGRELEHRELGKELLDRLKNDIEPYGAIEMAPKPEGRQMIMVIVPKKQ